MSEFNDFKDKVMSTIGAVADITKDAVSKTADATKSVARIAKLSVEVGSEKELIKKTYTEIGRLYYESNKDNPEAEFSQLCEEVAMSEKAITKKEEEISRLKTSSGEKDRDDNIEVDFEEIFEEDACDCGCDCGCREHSDNTEPVEEETVIAEEVEPQCREESCECGSCGEDDKPEAE